MKNKQSGFTLIEIAIVLVIIGLLLGGILKGQELINSAKVKNFATDFKNIPIYIYGYQDKFKALPGDDPQATTHLTGASANGNGNGVLDGKWDSQTATDESILFWEHVRRAGLAAGETTINFTTFPLKNAEGGLIGITSNVAATRPIATLVGSYVICSDGILGKFVKQLDITLDDGNTATGSMQTMARPAANHATPWGVDAAAVATTSIDDATSYSVCMTL